MSSFSQIMALSRNGLMTYLDSLDIVSNNMANIGTIGYKANRGNFQEMLTEQVLEGMQMSSSQILMSQGRLRTTDNPLDLAVEGEGFFALQISEDQIGYSRDGQLYVDADNQFVNADGYPLIWDGEIPEDAEEIHVNPDGTVMVRQGDVWSEAGSIPLTRFPNPTGLYSNGRNMWVPSDASGEPIEGVALENGYGQILGSALEESNVDYATEMSEMIVLQRSYEMALRSFQQTDQMLSLAINLR